MKIAHDFHMHTSLSLCAEKTANVKEYVESAKKAGFEKLGFANHFWDAAIPGANDFYVPQHYDHVESMKPEIEEAKKSGLTLYFGCECEYDPYRHGVACTPEVAEKFEFMIVPNSHTHMMMPKDYYHPYEKHAEFMVNAYEEILNSEVAKYITGMAHPFEAVACPYDRAILIGLIKEDVFKRLFTLQAEKGIAFEINLSCLDQKKPDEFAVSDRFKMFKTAKDCGCQFIFGTDIHSSAKYAAGVADAAMKGANLVAEMLGLREEDIIEIAR